MRNFFNFNFCTLLFHYQLMYEGLHFIMRYFMIFIALQQNDSKIKILPSHHIQLVTYDYKELIIIILGQIIMKSCKFKEKIINRGNSQFIRQKLQEQYNPKVRIHKQQLMILSIIENQNKFHNKAKQEWHVCQKAISKLRQGKQIILDWNTKSNFRSTNTQFKPIHLKSQLPQISTEPSELNYLKSSSNKSRFGGPKTIQEKTLQLQKLLYVQHKKHYFINKKYKEDHRRLFGDDLDIRSLKLGESPKRRSKAISHPLSGTNHRQRIQEIQQALLNNSKLNILRQELQLKFDEIKQMYHKSSQLKKDSSLQSSQRKKKRIKLKTQI